MTSPRGPRKFPRTIKARFPVLYPILDAETVLRGSAAPTKKRRWERLRSLVRELADAGVEILQYRNKDDDDVVVAEDLLAMKEAAGTMRLILNDRAALVMAAGWGGVHVGQGDLSPMEARQMVGRGGLVGLSTHNEAQMIVANREPVDYVAIGPVFATASKFDASPVIGLEGVARARTLTEKPLIAIGGITRETAPAVYDAGADSVAVIGAIFGSNGTHTGPGVRSAADCARDFLEIFK
ncbi:MAG TPA: thiamine phosphate synthase [Acidobacteriaceae bacterium]|jgi:thiamine-phosphate pyrophosphorylase|nr:thiamine phosphate synthase [Acidobacteriaceae bacterium]